MQARLRHDCRSFKSLDGLFGRVKNQDLNLTLCWFLASHQSRLVTVHLKALTTSMAAAIRNFNWLRHLPIFRHPILVESGWKNETMKISACTRLEVESHLSETFEST